MRTHHRRTNHPQIDAVADMDITMAGKSWTDIQQTGTNHSSAGTDLQNLYRLRSDWAKRPLRQLVHNSRLWDASS